MGAEFFAGIKSVAQLLARAQESAIAEFPDPVWQGAALARRLDLGLYQTLIEGITPPPDFQDFVGQPSIEAIDSSNGIYQLRASARETFLVRWREDPALKAIATRLISKLGPTPAPLDLLALEIVANPPAAENTFVAIYDAADARFDLAACEAVLDVVRQRAVLLSSGLRATLAAREQYLASRVMFLEDYYRTVSYLNRGDTLKELAGFLPSGGTTLRLRKPWVLNLHGKGGAGKSMFVRWAMTRHLIPAQSKMRIAVARLDVDYLNRDVLIRQPWLVLLSAAEQLNPQLPGLPFATFLGPDEIKLRKWLHNRSPVLSSQEVSALTAAGKSLEPFLKDKFADGLGRERALLIFDTVEELSLHYPTVLESLLRMLRDVRVKCSGMHVMLSGRYKVFDPACKFPTLKSDEVTQWQKDCKELPLGPFLPEDSRRYLTELRGIGGEQPVEEIVKVAGGNPFTLALFADLAAGRTLSAEDVRNSKVQFEYLIERIIDRIPDEDVGPGDNEETAKSKRIQRALRWLLRYIVIRRELTREFAESVLAPFLFDELTGREKLDDANNLKAAGVRYENTKRWHKLDLPVKFSDIWSALESYASASSWISGSGEILNPQPEIVVPMRQLLTQEPEKYPIFPRLHQAAAEHFEKLAEGAASPAALLNEALYHRFQGEGQAAAKWWVEYRRRCRESQASFAAVEALATSLFGEDYRDENHEPLLFFAAAASAPAAAARSLPQSTEEEHRNRQPIIDKKTLADAALDGLLAGAMCCLREPDVRDEGMRDRMNLRVADLRAYGYDSKDPRNELARRAVVALTLHPTNESPQTQAPAVLLLADRDEQVAAALMAAGVTGYGSVIQFAEAWPTGYFPLSFVREQAARADLAAGELEVAFDGFGIGLAAAIAANDVAGTQRLMAQAGELGYALGRWSVVETLAKQAEAVYPAAVEWPFRLAIERFRYRDADELMPATAESNADLAAATFNFAAAQSGYTQAREQYQSKDPIGESRVVLKYATYLLDATGSVLRARRALDSLSESRALSDPLIQLQTWLLQLRCTARSGDIKKARALYQQALDFIAGTPAVPRTYAALAVATLLAEGLGTAEEVQGFMAELAKWPPSARAWAVRPFLVGREEARSPTAPQLVRVDTPEIPAPYLAAYLIFFGQSAAAQAMLLSFPDSEPDLMAVCYRVAHRISPGGIGPAPDWVARWQSLGAANPGYAAVVLLEEAERLFAAGSLEQSWNVLKSAQPFRAALDQDSQWAARFAALADQLEGKRPDKESLLRSLTALKPSDLLRNSAHVSVDVPADLDELIVEGMLELPGQKSEGSTRSSGAFSRYLIRSVRAGGLYPTGGVQIMNAKRNDWRAWGRRLWRFVTETEWDPIGVEGFRAAAGRVWPSFSVWSAGIAVTCGAPSLSAVPWEMIAKKTDASRFFRTVAGSPLSDTTRYLRRAVESVELPPGSTGAWPDFVTRMGGDAKFRDEILQRMPESAQRRVMTLTGSAESQRREQRSYSSHGIDLESMYSRNGITPIQLPLEGEWPGMGNKASIVHVVATVGETFSRREPFLTRPGGLAPIYGDIFARAFGEPATPRLRPLVILEVPENRFDPGRTLMLRNAFASRIFVESTRGVLAIGPYGEDTQEAAISSLIELLKGPNGAIGDLHAKFLAQSAYPEPALFTLDPDLPVWD